MKTAKKYNPIRKRGWLGDASASFVQGGNQVQTFVLLFVVILVILYLLPNVNKLFDMFSTKPLKNPPDNNTAGGGNGTNTAGMSSTPENVPPLKQHNLLRWLLNKAGYYNGTVMLSDYNAREYYTSGTDKALQEFSKAERAGTMGVTSLDEWIELLKSSLRMKRAINGAKTYILQQVPQKRTVFL